jgi:RNA polymerase sigma-70 factor (ECF subfamily)
VWKESKTPMSRDVQDLVEEARRGSRPAFDALVALYRDRLEKFIRSRLGPALKARVEVDDVLQETLLQAFCSIGRLEWRDEEAFVSWLGTIAERVIRHAANKERGTLLLHPLPDAPGSRIPPSTALRREERFERLQAALGNLTPEHREVILLARIERLSFKEVGERMGRSPQAAQQLLLRALQKLKSAFGHTESLHLPDRTLAREDAHEHR